MPTREPEGLAWRYAVAWANGLPNLIYTFDNPSTFGPSLDPMLNLAVYARPAQS